MDHKLTVAAIPLDIAWVDRDENLYAAAALAHKVGRDADVIIFPELFSTGFITDTSMLTRLCDSANTHPTLDAVRTIAADNNCAVCASWVWCDNNRNFYNRCFFVEPNGEVSFYDKQHLFALSPEARIFTAGVQSIPVVRFRGWNIAMAVCYDTRFPETLRNKPEKYDILIIPANWPDARRYAWEHLLIARAIENQAFVVGANRSGKDDFGVYTNTSHILDYLGMDISQSTNNPNGIITATLSHNSLDDARHGFPVLV